MKTFKWCVRAAVVATTFILSMANMSAFADTLPGSGKTVRYVQADSLGANYVADQIVARAMKSLGYDVKLSTMNITLFFAAVAQGDVDLSTDVNLPQREPEFRPSKSRRKSSAPGSLPGAV